MSIRRQSSQRHGTGLRSVAALGIVLAAAGVTVVSGATPAGASAPSIVFLSEPFTGSQVQIPADWVRPALPSGTTGSNVACLTASSSTSQSPIPGCANPAIDTAPGGTLRLTSAATNLDGGASYSGTVPRPRGSTSGSTPTSTEAAARTASSSTWPGPIRPAPRPSTLGPPGGHLGYSGGTASPTGNGLANGYLGIGFDVYGNYTNSSFDGSGCTNPSWVGSATAVPVRSRCGTRAGTVGYCPLGSTKASGGLKGQLGGSSTATRTDRSCRWRSPSTRRPRRRAPGASPTSPLYSYVVAVSPLGGPTQYVTGTLPNASSFEPSSWLDPATGIPYQLAMGFAASTGASTDVHEIRNVAVQPLFANPAQIGIQLTDSASGQLVQNTPVTYTASAWLSAGGGSLNQGLSLIATLPTGVAPGTATGTDWSCGTSGQTVTCSYTGTLPIPAGTALPAVTIPATVAEGASGPVTATAQAVSDDAEVATGTDAGTINATASASPLLGVAVSDDVGGSFSQGGSANYAIQGTVSSGGGAEADAPTLSDTLPASLAPGTATGTDWSCGVVGQTVTCTWSGALPIAPGTVLPLVTVPVTVSSTASGGLTNTVALSSSDATTVHATDYGSVTSLPVYGLTLTDSKSGDIPAKGSFTYTATPSLSSVGGTESQDPALTLSLASGVTASAATGTGWTCSLLSTDTVVSCVFSGRSPHRAHPSPQSPCPPPRRSAPGTSRAAPR